MTDYTYFQIKTPGVKDKRFIRMEHEGVNSEWREMCTAEGRTFPFVIFDQTTKTTSFAAVLLQRLSRVPEAISQEVEEAWAQSIEAETEQRRAAPAYQAPRP